jgi:hypothetical protein
MLAQEQKCSEVDLPTLDHPQRHWEPPSQARSRHATTGFVVAHPEPSDAEVEERGARRLEIQPSRLHLAEMREQARKDDSSLANERMQIRKQLFIRYSRERRFSHLHRLNVII